MCVKCGHKHAFIIPMYKIIAACIQCATVLQVTYKTIATCIECTTVLQANNTCVTRGHKHSNCNRFLLSTGQMPHPGDTPALKWLCHLIIRQSSHWHCMNTSTNCISFIKQAYMLCKVTHCAGHVSANTRPHQLRWGDREMGTAIWHSYFDLNC